MTYTYLPVIISTVLSTLKSLFNNIIHLSVGIEEVIDTIGVDNWINVLLLTGWLTAFILYNIKARGGIVISATPIFISVEEQRAGGVVRGIARGIIDLNDPSGTNLSWWYLGITGVRFTQVRYLGRLFTSIVFTGGIIPAGIYPIVMAGLPELANNRLFMGQFFIWLHNRDIFLGEACIIAVTSPSRAWWSLLTHIFGWKVFNVYGFGRTEITVNNIMPLLPYPLLPLRATREDVIEPLSGSDLYNTIADLNRSIGR